MSNSEGTNSQLTTEEIDTINTLTTEEKEERATIIHLNRLVKIVKDLNTLVKMVNNDSSTREAVQAAEKKFSTTEENFRTNFDSITNFEEIDFKTDSKTDILKKINFRTNNFKNNFEKLNLIDLSKGVRSILNSKRNKEQAISKLINKDEHKGTITKLNAIAQYIQNIQDQSQQSKQTSSISKSTKISINPFSFFTTNRGPSVEEPGEQPGESSVNQEVEPPGGGGRRAKRAKKSKRAKKRASWKIAQDKFKKKSLRTNCGKRGGKYPTKKTCPKECDFIDMGSGGTYCNPKKTIKRSKKAKKSRKTKRR